MCAGNISGVDYVLRRRTVIRVPTLPGKRGILSYNFPGLENAWNFLEKWQKPGILTQNLEKDLNFENLMVPS